MIGFLLDVIWTTWGILKDASVFLLFGFLLAGALAVLVPGGLLTRLVGTGNVRSVLWASVLGLPLPLCSCGVLPTALGLRRQGATPGATVAFLVATPETGADSISLTYALTDPIMTVFRPIAGIVTAIAAGLATNLLGAPRPRAATAAPIPAPQRPLPTPSPQAGEGARSAGGGSGSAGSNEASARPDGHCADHAHLHDDGHDRRHIISETVDGTAGVPSRRGAIAAAMRVVRYGYVELFDDVAWWLALGLILSAVLEVAIPPGLFEGVWGNGLFSMLLMLVLSIPLYTCASSSTPMAAALALKGLSPGAILVFLLAGPATNAGSLVVLLKVLGRRAVAVYVAAVAVISLAAGFALDVVYRGLGVDPRATFGTAGEFIPESVKIAGAIVLIGLIIASMCRTRAPDEWVWFRDGIAGLTGVRVTARRLGYATAVIAVCLWIGSGVFTVGPGEVGMRLRFGQVVASNLEPGLHFRLPWPFEGDRIIASDLVRRIAFGAAPKLSREEATRAQIRGRAAFGAGPAAEHTSGVFFQKEAGPEDPALLTGDGNLIDLKYVVQFRVKNALAYTYDIAEPEPLVRSTILSALRSVAATRAIDAVYTTAREEIERSTIEAAQSMLDRYGAGIEIISVNLLYDHPPEAVHDAFRDVASAQEDKLRTINLANVFGVEKINQAKGEAAAMTEAAAAFKEQRIKGAQADADAFRLRLDAYRRAPELTKFRLQLEALEEVLPGVRKFVRPGSGDVKDFDLWLLQPPAASQGR